MLAPAEVAPAGGGARDTIPLVRERVRALLTSSPAFARMPAAERRDLAQAMVNVGQYLVDAGGETRDAPLAAVIQEAPAGARVARGLADPPPPRPNTAGARFKDQGGATAAEAGVDQFTELVDKVDFPKFVAGLIDGVFNAIVDSSIRQMEAFAELVKNVSKSVDSFMKDNVSPDQARDYLVDRYPEHLSIDPSGGEATVAVKPDADTDDMPDFFADLGLDVPMDSVDDETAEQVLVPAARRRMAMDRQQVLLTMVLMGLNRLVVTDGSIRATVVFDLNTRDRITKHRERATDYNRRVDSKYSRRPGFWGWFKPNATYEETASSDFKVHTVNTEDSEAKVEMKAKLTGDVNIRFKSETFPLDQMTRILGVEEPKAPAPAPAAVPAAPGATPLPPVPAAPGAPGR